MTYSSESGFPFQTSFSRSNSSPPLNIIVLSFLFLSIKLATVCQALGVGKGSPSVTGTIHKFVSFKYKNAEESTGTGVA